MYLRKTLLPSLIMSVMLIAPLPRPPARPALFTEPQPAFIAGAESHLRELPLQFEANRGQAEAGVIFLARGPGYNVLLGTDGALLALAGPSAGQPPTVTRLQLVGAASEPMVTGLEPLPGVVNYYLGSDPSAWNTRIPTFRKVRYQEVYPGIDLVFFGQGGQLEHDFLLAPGANPDVITLCAQGADAIRVDPGGDLVLTVGEAELRLAKPLIYQNVGGRPEPIDGGYVLKGDGRYGFWVDSFDTDRPLFIDPVLSYSTYFGGSGDDWAHSIALDAAGDVYITGSTTSTDLPLMNPARSGSFGGGVNCPSDETPYRLCYDAFVTRLSAAGSELIYSTYIGLPGDDEGRGIAVDSAGNAYMTGFVSLNSESLPDMFICKYAQLARLDPAGALTYWTSFGSVESKGLAIAVDSAGQAYVTGRVASSGFPTTANAIQADRLELVDAFVAAIDPAGDELLYSTYLGGSGEYCGLCSTVGRAIAVDDEGMIYVAGQAAASFPTTANAYQRSFDGLWKAFVAKIDPALPGESGLLYSTLLGGTTLSDFAYGLALDGDGNVYVTGSTQTDDFPTTANAFDRTCGTDGICNTTDNMVCDYVLPGQPPICHVDAKSDVFVAKLDPSQSGAASLLYATYIGGSGHESGHAIAVDGSGRAHVTGKTASPDFPSVAPIQREIGGNFDVFALRLGPAGSSLDASTFLGGGGDDVGQGIAVDLAGSAHLTGWTGSQAFPTADPLRPRAGGWEVFVAEISYPDSPQPGPGPLPDLGVFLPLVLR
ncbi:MAG: hypothetical protein HPY83_00820 [Anaerolineae bacterium]|nr:hypothetical protein [Anaerolineae bacterium]